MNKLNLTGIKEKLKKDKRLLLALVAGLLGMLLILFSSVTAPAESEKDSDYFLQQTERDKKELTELLSAINGAGKVEAMITYESSEELIFALDEDISSDDTRRDTKREHIIIDAGSDETGLLTKTVYPKVRGVAVVCQGGDNPIIKEQIITMVAALFDISTNKITVAGGLQ